ncbi:MAG: phosphoribosylformylglycinamidine synthase subunit PurQ [Planctomycetota bacterium]|nr:phosphoribosylformylglycinamidine synthase subunit PurQ [Planctomycetota bacterium]
MSVPRICVLRAPGTNCDEETAFAFESCGAQVQRVHLFRLLENPAILSEFQLLCIPGGFSYGDDVGAGVIFGRQMQGQLGDVVNEFLAADKLVLGICNGFQVLLRAGILPDGAVAPAAPRNTTLTWNDNGKYTALWVRLQVQADQNVFLRDIDEIELPIAHAEGRIAVTDPRVVEQWREHGQIGLCYQSRNGASDGRSLEPLGYPDNPNGSIANIAGLSDRSGRVLGLMPHPERFIHATQHPNWTRLRLRGDGDGLKLFRNAVQYFA